MEDSDLYFKPPTCTNVYSDDSCSFPSFPWFPENIRRRKSRLGTHRKQARVFQDLDVINHDLSSSKEENVFDRFSNHRLPNEPVDALSGDPKPTVPSIFNRVSHMSPFPIVMEHHHHHKSPTLSFSQAFQDKISPIMTLTTKSNDEISPFPQYLTESKFSEILNEIPSPNDEQLPSFSPSTNSTKLRSTEVLSETLSGFGTPQSVKEMQTVERQLNGSYLKKSLIDSSLSISSNDSSCVELPENNLSCVTTSVGLKGNVSPSSSTSAANPNDDNVIANNSSLFATDIDLVRSELSVRNLPTQTPGAESDNIKKTVNDSFSVLTPDVNFNQIKSVSVKSLSLSNFNIGSDCTKSTDRPENDSLSNKKVDVPVINEMPQKLFRNNSEFNPPVDMEFKENIIPENNQSKVQPADFSKIPISMKSPPETHFVEPLAVREFAVSRISPKIPSVIHVKGKGYKVLNILGTGGSSIVYQVSHPETNELLAIKKVELSENDDDITEGYLNEVQMLEGLQNCDVIIKIFDHQLVHTDCRKTLFVVMEKGDTDLSSLIRSVNESKKLSIPMIIYYWTEMLAAVNEVHRRGIIHSDLKPANFVLVRGRLKLIDFGIASSMQGDMTSVYKDSFCGTLNYMSPEATSYVRCPSGTAGYKITFKTDVWSLGCILYNLIYGHLPFYHIKKRIEKIYAIVSPSVLIEFPEKKDVPPILMNSLKSCLEKDFKRRPTVQELLDRTMRIFQCSNTIREYLAKRQDAGRIPRRCMCKYCSTGS